MELLKGKKALILGVANNKSIAYGIAKAFSDNGAEISLTYPNDKIEKRLIKLSNDLNVKFIEKCDVSNEEDIINLAKRVKEEWGELDILVHSIAYANKEYLKDYYYKIDRNSFLQAMDISVYSFTALARELLPILKEGSSLMTLTYYGSQKVIYSYNVMGVAKAALEASVRYLARDLGELKNIRVNSISAGPIKTLAASGIDNFYNIQKTAEQRSPLKKVVTIEEVGNTALFLASDLSTGITGETIYVDAGYHIIGM